mmetsp:Transcript_21034/g.33729  ORF Transcript_21034/g.33729 Transcript_21034/m.33729 type:complete len:536 (-) Transcript_21034:128-1735(-)|eukprot:CAMPEP_0202692024 /NCGR_PEP_ID=MMETSP1385-20130828/6528_1 /ASSEMBLY_ACC=CAM_ASM_000861 /TAXON_ID=933848 /ORGANISM="Elphidium margaritaceum" /LENGTH=535 /DNA_ID=CAMNT_0049347495 /DNA_START=41 /DNA_END=1648 /DNA_ORIENTATION=+
MPQVKCISRSPADRLGYHRNFASTEHRFGRAREYVRALRAAKLEKLHAKPFVTSLDGHVETVCNIEKVRNSLPLILSADYDGEIRCWDISQHLLNWRVQGHSGRVMGLTVTNNTHSSPNLVISTGIDKTIKIWLLKPTDNASSRPMWERDDAAETDYSYIANRGYDYGGNSQKAITSTTAPRGGAISSLSMSEYGAGDQLPISTINHYEPLRCIDANWQRNSTLYATGSAQVSLWDVHRSHALHQFAPTPEQCTHLAFNPSQHNVLASCMQDSKITFYDVRTKTEMSFITLLNWGNELKWNPIDPRIFVVATNDWCLYTFDVRHTRKALRTHRGHVDAVTTCDWSATGKEFVSGAVDGHIRLWKSNHQTADARGVGYSRELYKGKRMYNLEQTRWTNDNKYILSGSADGAIRLWKSQRSMPLHRVNARQRSSIAYAEKLKTKYQHMPEIGLIVKFRHAKIPHRIPRNGVYYKRERREQKKVKELKEKVNEKIDNTKEYARQSGPKWRVKVKAKKQRRTWSEKVVVKRGIVGDHQE